MDNKFVKCGAYVTDGGISCCDFEQKSKTPAYKTKRAALCRKIPSFLLGLIMCFTLTACSSQQADKTEETAKIDNIVVDVKTPDGSCYSTFSDVEIDYYDGEISNVFVNNNSGLAYSVSDAYEGGAYIIQGTDFDQIKSDMESAQKALEKGDIAAAQNYLTSASDLSQQYTVYDYCPT